MYLINLKVKKKLITKILGSGDFETILYENNHYVYAIGVLFENKYKHFILDVDKLNLSNIEDISLSLIKEFINYSININKNNIKFFIYFHNLRRFNGIFILKCFKKFYKKKNIKVLIRDNNIFKIQYNNLIFLDSLNIINNISKSFLNKEKEEIISFKGLLISKLNNIKFTYLKNKWIKDSSLTINNNNKSKGTIILHFSNRMYMTLNKNVNKDSNNRLDTILRNSLKIDDYEMIHNFINENTFLNKKYISILNLNDDGDFIDYMKSQVKSDSSSINTIIYDSIKITIQNYLFQNFEINRKQKISFEIPISILTNGIIQSLIKNYEVNYSKKILSKWLKDLFNSLLEVKKVFSPTSDNGLNFNYQWHLVIDNNSVQTFLKEFYSKNLLKYISINQKPYQWYFVDNKKQIVLNKNKKINDILKFLSVSQLKFDLHIKKYHIINFLNKINILQEIPYSIDKNLLCDHLEKYNIYDLYNSISKDIKISLDINYNDYIEKDLYNRLCNNNKKFNSDVHYRKEYMDQLTKQIESLIYSNHIIKNELKIKQSKILKILDILSLVFYSLIQQKDKVYHYKQIDTRGRLYHNGPNSFISDKILRSILIVVDDDKKKAPLRWVWFKELEWFKNRGNDYDEYYLACLYGNPKNFYDSIRVINENKNKTLDSSLNTIKINKFLKYKEKCTISLDASNSLLQWISVITKNKKMMHYTNVFYSKKSVDLYTYIIEKLEIIYKDNLFISFYKNRNIVKETCMLYLYGSQPLKIAKKIILLYNITNILLIDLINICNNILKLFKSEFAILEKIKKLVYYYINILPIDLDIHFNIDGKSLKYNCPLKKDINFKLYSEKHKKNSNCYVSAKLETTKASYENKRKYALVNLVHSIDSNACVNIRYNLYKKGITTQYVQDCFICVLENYEKVLNEYNKQLLRFFNISFLDILLELKDITFYNKIWKHNLKNDLNIILSIIYNYIMYIKNQKLKDNMSKPLTELINKMLTQQKSNKVNFIIENKELLKSLVKDSCLMSKIFLLWKEIEFKKLNKLISSLKEEETFDIKNQNFILNSLYSIKPE